MAQLEPVVRDRVRDELAHDPAFITTSAFVIADVTTKWGRRFVTNFLHASPVKGALATVGAAPGAGTTSDGPSEGSAPSEGRALSGGSATSDSGTTSDSGARPEPGAASHTAASTRGGLR